ncbi:PKD domain-containing protein [Candidatus Chloroploca asiatica]|uniref:PKD domain-containing protein n=1 Tax=Candidatus Chloroploca asiatica TaxID=1506545 RepID=A0A2H3KH86_9CHLR|nr:PKD domain-containing protein [Candidatus Chloroploca asiatica]PDV97124.1 hypothetical protein A9Q02_19250 [Candidatus Chloroploca asiatica]
MGIYALMYIYGEDTLGDQTTPGMRNNEPVSFYVNSIAASATPTFSWVNSWQSVRVDLSATGGNPPPVAAFTAVPTEGVAPLLVQFTDTSTGTITTRTWAFGDGGTSTAPNPAHRYTTPGSYTVTLTVDGPGGQHTTTRPNAITVTPPAPVAAFTAVPTEGVAPLVVQFTDTSTGTITAHTWAFGDGGTSTAPNPAHRYTTPGSYTVTLTVDGPGGQHTITRPNAITVTPPPPVAAFTATPTEGVAPLVVQFTDTSTGTITARTWAFGDGGMSTAPNPAHRYTTPGSYTVTLTVDGPGGQHTITRPNAITVTPPAPVAAFTATPTEGVAPLVVQFTDTSTGTITTRTWAFGDGGTSTQRHPMHTYVMPGIYTVTLHVSGLYDSDSTTQQVRVRPALPIFTATPSETNSLTVHFTFEPPDGATHWLWEFGDDQTSTLQNPIHTFPSAGNYLVRLTVYTSDGLSSVEERSLQVQEGSSQIKHRLYLPAMMR